MGRGGKGGRERVNEREAVRGGGRERRKEREAVRGGRERRKERKVVKVGRGISMCISRKVSP